MLDMEQLIVLHPALLHRSSGKSMNAERKRRTAALENQACCCLTLGHHVFRQKPVSSFITPPPTLSSSYLRHENPTFYACDVNIPPFSTAAGECDDDTDGMIALAKTVRSRPNRVPSSLPALQIITCPRGGQAEECPMVTRQPPGRTIDPIAPIQVFARDGLRAL